MSSENRGAEYKAYMENPYKFSADNYLYDNDFFQNMASQFGFANEDVAFDDAEKAEITATTVTYSTNGRDISNEPNSNNVQPETVYTSVNDKYLKITLVENGTPIDATDPAYRMHLEYMRNVILKYVAQVVPSTTLLVLDNFETPEGISEDTVEITARIVGEGVVYGTGEYLKSTMVTLNAVPADGYHFIGWQAFGRNIPQTPTTQLEPQYTSMDNILTVMACSDTEYTAVFGEDCGIGFGCEAGNCGGSPAID
mgnify:CR=1 FL=1